MNVDSIEQTHYISAKDLRDELDELGQIGDPLYTDAIEDLQAGPQAIVDAVETGEGSLDIPAQDMMQAGLDAGEECLSGAALNAYAKNLTGRIDKLPAENGGTAEETCSQATRGRYVTGKWELIVYSRGAADHQKWVEEFYETVSALSDDYKSGCVGTVEIAQLTYEASLLRVMVMASGEAEPNTYQEVQRALEEWLTATDQDEFEVLVP